MIDLFTISYSCGILGLFTSKSIKSCCITFGMILRYIREIDVWPWFDTVWDGWPFNKISNKTNNGKFKSVHVISEYSWSF